MRHRILAVSLLAGLMASAMVSAQEFPNRASLEMDGLLLTGMIDKFAYHPGETIKVVYKAINPWAGTIVVEAQRTCASIGRLEWWCDPNTHICLGLPTPIPGCVRQSVEFPPGETILASRQFTAFNPGGGGIDIPDSGRILFLDPWGEPPAYKIVLEYRNASALAVAQSTWGAVKHLYKQ